MTSRRVKRLLELSIVIFGLAFLASVTMLVHALKTTEYPKPVEQCFTGATKEMNYCRSQTRW